MAQATNASSSSALLALTRTLSRFLAWWRAELVALIPRGLREWWRGADNILLLSFQGDRCVFERPAAGRRLVVLTVDAGTGSSARAHELGRQLAQVSGRHARLLLCVPPAQVLRRTVTLPLAVEENLRQSLTFELDRYTPFRPDQVYFDFRLLERDPVQRRMKVELAAVLRSAVDREAARAAALGAPVSGALMEAKTADGASFAFNFLAAPAGSGKPSIRTWWRSGLALLATLMLVALLAVPILQKRATAIALLPSLDQARVAALETDALRDHLDQIAKEYSFLIDMKWAAPSTLLILEDLSKRLADDSYIVQFDFDGKTVQLQGESPSATSLVEHLEASPLFKDVGFKAQLTKIQGTPNDRFHIAATLEADAAPKPVPPAASAATTPPPPAEPGPPPAAAAVAAAAVKPATKP